MHTLRVWGYKTMDAWRWCGLKHTTNLLIRHGSYEDDAKIVGAPSESIGCKHPNRDGGLVFHFFWADIFYDTTVLDMTHKYPRSLGKRTYICLTALNYVHNFHNWLKKCFFTTPPIVWGEGVWKLCQTSRPYLYSCLEYRISTASMRTHASLKTFHQFCFSTCSIWVTFKTHYDSPFYWLVHRDPYYNGLLLLMPRT